MEDLVIDQHFYSVLAHFKKIYSVTKSEYITQNLLKYVLKFQNIDKFSQKTKFK